MRVLHTSDWHLGRTFHQKDLTASHQDYLDHLLTLVQREAIDVVLIAGDCYDRVYPPITAVSQLHETLTKLADHAHVILTSGNHDSPERLGFLSGLTCERIHLRTTIAAGCTPLVLAGRDGQEVAFCALPYLSIDASRRELRDEHGELPPRNHQAVIDATMTRLVANVEALRAKRGEMPLVISAHAFVAGARASDSERDISVGGVDRIAASSFDAAKPSYVALGHLHRPQNVTGGSAPIRYSGSPVALSFSELADHKSSTIVEISQEDVQLQVVDAPVRHPLHQLRGTLSEVLQMRVPADAWVKVILTDTLRPPHAYQQLRDAFAGLVVLTFEPEGAVASDFSLPEETRRQPLAVADAFFAHVRGGEPLSKAQAALVRASYEQIREEA